MEHVEIGGSDILRTLGPFDLANDVAYRRWRDKKLAAYPTRVEDLVVKIGDLATPTHDEEAQIRSCCQTREHVDLYVRHR